MHNVAQVVGRAIRTSAGPYLCVLAVGIVLARLLQYLWPTTVVFKGQPAATLFTIATFLVALALWLLLRGRRLGPRPLIAFIALLTLSWVLHMVIDISRDDLFNHTAWLFVPILMMIVVKAPDTREGWAAITALAWTTSAVLIGTRVLEMAGVLQVRFVPEGIVQFDSERYWLPLNDLMGLATRWPGPFGHNGDTAMMGALLVVIGLARLRRSSWVFVIVGALTLLLTDGRSSMGASVVGIVILLMFARRGWVSRIPRTVRIPGGLVVMAAGAAYLFLRPSGLTGRERIWPAFLDLWQGNMLTGAGTVGISVSGGVTQEFGHAHNLFIDELARYGLVGALPLFAALIVGLLITIRAAVRGFAAPLAVLAAFLVTAITEPRNNWTHPSVTGFLVILCVATAAAWPTESSPAEPLAPDPEEGSDRLALEPTA